MFSCVCVLGRGWGWGGAALPPILSASRAAYPQMWPEYPRGWLLGAFHVPRAQPAQHTSLSSAPQGFPRGRCSGLYGSSGDVCRRGAPLMRVLRQMRVPRPPSYMRADIEVERGARAPRRCSSSRSKIRKVVTDWRGEEEGEDQETASNPIFIITQLKLVKAYTFVGKN